MNLTPDFTLVLQVILFIIVWRGLSRLAFTPTSEVLAQRVQRTVAAEREAVAMVSSAGADRDTYDRTVQERRAQMATEIASARNAAQEESSRALNDAREAANKGLAAQRAVVAEQIDSARAKLSSSADEIAAQMLGRVTGNAS